MRVVTALLSILASMTVSADVIRFTNAHWYDGVGFEVGDRYVQSDQFVAPTDEVSQTVDLEGRWVIPPLADAHHHAFSSPHELDRTIEAFLSAGIFYVKNPNNPRSMVEPIRSRMNRRDSVDVVWSNGGITSPGGHPVQIYERLSAQVGREPDSMDGDAWFAVDSESDVERIWPALVEGDPDFVKVYLERGELHEKHRDDPEFYGRRGVDPQLLPSIVDRAHASELSVSVHVTSAADFRAAVAAGADEINHLPLERLTPADAKATADEGVTVVTTTISHRPADGVDDLDAVHRHNLKLLAGAGVMIAAGTDDGRLVTEELANLRRLGVFPTIELLRIATVVTPAAIFPDRSLGRLESGYEASFLVLDRNPLEDWDAIRRPAILYKQGRLLEIEPPTPALPGIADRLGHLIMQTGIDAAIEEYHRLRETSSDQYDFSEKQLNDLGYALIRHGRIDDAITIFRLNTEMFPDAPNPWDSLGEALLEKGDLKGALENYEKALRLNPHNENARKIIDRLRNEIE